MSKPAYIILFKIWGFLFFLILLAIANILIPSINNNLYEEIVIFLNANLILLFILTGIGMVNELFWSFNFPFNILAPITGGALGVYVLIFFYKVWNFLEGYLNVNVNFPMDSLYILIFFFVMVLGYIIILSRHGKTREDREERWKRRHEKMGKNKKNKEKEVEWEDVEKEFRLIFYNIGKGINKLFEGKEKKRRK